MFKSKHAHFGATDPVPTDRNPSRRDFMAAAAGSLGVLATVGAEGFAQDAPPKAPEVQLVPNLKTVPVSHDEPLHNFQLVSVKPLPKDRDGIWVLDFAFKPLRIKQLETEKGRQPIHYLYYKVVNRTGAPRIFVPQLTMVNEGGTRFEDTVIPRIVPLIQAREDASIPVLGAVTIMGTIPPSTKPHVDDAVFGVAVWDKWDPHTDRFSIYVRGLSDGYKEIPAKDPDKPPIVKYKTLKIDFIRRGDDRNLDEREIQLNDPPYEWVYW